MPGKRKKQKSNNFVKKYMDLLTKPSTHSSVKDYDRASSKLDLKKEVSRDH